MPDTNNALREAAARIRSRAFDAADDRDGDVLCCWDAEMLAGHERVIGIRRHPDGTSQDIAALTAAPGMAEHIAVWDPPAARAVADLLDAVADPSLGVPPRVHEAALTLARHISGEREHRDES